jgi:hypothetical protein
MGAFDDLIPQAEEKSAPGGLFDDLVPQATQRKPMPSTELSVGEKIVSALPKGVQEWLSNPSVAGVGLGKGSTVNAAMMGAADPVVGALQLATGGQSSTINQAIDDKNAEYEQARAGQGRDGVDVARIVGNVASPANLAVTAVAPINAASTAGKVLQGARAGLVGGLAAPVENADESFLPEKLMQGATGATVGGVMTPVMAKTGERVIRSMVGLSPAQASQQADQIMIEGMNRLQRDGIKLSMGDTQQLRRQVMQALQKGEKIDPAAVFRKADFEALGMQPTLGQITRDSSQFSREKNLRGVAGVGEPLLDRLNTQSTRLQELITGKSAGAADDYTAGQSMMQALKGVDDGMNAKVGAAYGAARDHLGRAAPMDHVQFSTEANLALDDQMLGRWLPTEVRGILNDVTMGKIPFTVNSAVQIDSVFSQAQRSAMNAGNPAQAKAVGVVRDALNRAQIADNVGEDAKMMFDTARGMARERFKLHEAIPALKASADGDISAQDFTRRFLINGKAEDVSGLAKVMPEEAKQEARRQFGAALERAAFGQNTTGDKAFSAESFARFINQPGMKQKLTAFFGKDEVAQIERIGRVGAYTNSFPANSTVNTSNTASAAANLLSKIPGLPQSLGVINAAKSAAGNYTAVNSALKANPAKAAADIAPEQQKLLARILGSGMAGVSGAAGAGIGDR